jgi:hypothetical protein
MQTKIRVKKREAVIPFDGEENFIVPKRGGFGQPDNANFVMVTGSTSKAPTTTATPTNLPSQEPTPTLDNTTTTAIQIGQPQQPIIPTTNTNPTPAEPSPNPTTGTPAPATPQQLCVAPNMWVNGQCLQGGVEQSPAELSCIASGGLWSGGINGTCTTSSSPKPLADAPVVDTLPTFPVWSSLDCTTLKDKIAEYNAILSTSKFSATIVEAYNTEIAKAQAIYNGKCNVTPPAPSPAPAPISILPVGGGGIFGGGGGGGLGEPPTDVAPVVEEKSNMGLYLILGGLALLYFLTRKKKK